jgi:hypothetical protein
VKYVRVTDDLWAQLEFLFPEGRPGDGSPSLHDFVSTTLVEVQRQFAEKWDDLAPTIPGRTEYRTVWGSALMSRATRSTASWHRTDTSN